jgi:hypothetical protein
MDSLPLLLIKTGAQMLDSTVKKEAILDQENRNTGWDEKL